MSAWYNENDPYAAAWLRNLIAAGHIAPGIVDERSIVDVRAGDLEGFSQCHFFAGIGGWPYALRLAGWPDARPVWTGSCPCQPLSSAGAHKGHADERHLWPAFHGLIAERRPPTVFGEQVASKDGREWLAGVRADLEDLGYAVGAADLCAAGVGAPHIRQRIWWLADSEQRGARPRQRAERSAPSSLAGRLANASGERRSGIGLLLRSEASGRNAADLLETAGCGETGRLADADGGHASAEGLQRSGQHGQQPEDGGIGGMGHAAAGGLGIDRSASREGGHADQPSSAGRLVDAQQPGLEGHGGNGAGLVRQVGQVSQPDRPVAAPGDAPAGNFWGRFDGLPCIDGKARRVEPVPLAMVDGVSASLGSIGSEQVGQIEKEIRAHAAAHETEPGRALLDLWCALGKEALERGHIGRSDGVRQAPILLAFLRQLEGQGWAFAQGVSRTGAQASGSDLRVLRDQQEVARPSSKRGLDQQRSGEPSDALRVLSSILARHAQAAWGDAFETHAAATFPVTRNAASRMGRLRAYGNAIVPQVAAEFIAAAYPGLLG